MPGRERVRSRRNVLESEAAVISGDLEIWIPHDRNVGLHPGMNVALDRNSNFFAREGLVQGSGSRRLRLVPLAIIHRNRMNVVRGLIGIGDVQSLANAKSHNVRRILAALLVDYCRS